ncbi:MAG TPA: GTPase HflX [Candidatus Bathyarchaeia archaeon]|nr:GTPase HflX [Candidatus Bathyarchaeia archaeon]
MIELERPPIHEKAILARLVLPSHSDDAHARDVEESIEELRQLAWTAGADVVRTFVQRRDRPDPATLIGIGKANQIKLAVEETEADVVIFDSDLGPAQGVKLEDLIGVKVIDRTQLILDIFAQRAQTNEGKHQVELAQLKYMLPRLAGRGSVMRQQGGIGVRGPGEQKLEVDRRIIRRRIRRLETEIENIRKSRHVQRRKRTEETMGTVALVGYTNAGKSSLLNAITGADVFVEDKLFATLDPRARRCTLPSSREIVLTDTVGFIRSLPHSLVAAFRATLEEVAEADLLLVVADLAHPHLKDHLAAVQAVLEEIHAGEKPVVNVFNKLDIAPETSEVRQMLHGPGARVGVSAKTGEGLNALLAEIDRQLSSSRRRVTLRIPQGNGAVIARVHQSSRVLNQNYEDNTVVIEAEIDPALEGALAEFIQK